MMTSYEPIIGLEVHAELLTQSKMFCGCAVVESTSGEPNRSVCEICTGMPGTLPVINRRAVEYAVKVALALNCRIAETSVFARKNYFYPDLPKGFQISQYELPLAVDGWITIDSELGEKRIRIRRVHLEEDTGKLFHHPDHSLVDYNRSGVPLLEIVTEPDLRSLEQVKSYATGLRSLLRYLGVNSGDMEKGVIRFEANVSIRPQGSTTLGTRTEIKNLNSFRGMLRAIEYELERQRLILERGGTVVQETVGWDEKRGKTFSQRGKEEAHDYRYFPEPDLPPMVLDRSWIEKLRADLPELPYQRRERLVQLVGLIPEMATILTAEKAVADFFEAALEVAPQSVPAEKLANWMSGEFFSLLNQSGLEIDACRVTPQALAQVVDLVESGVINAASGKAVLAAVFSQGGDPQAIVEARGLAQINDSQQIRRMIETILQSNPEQVGQYLDGKVNLSQWFFGQVMQAARGKADPQIVQAELDAALKALDEHPQQT